MPTHYISSSDVTDKVVSAFDVAAALEGYYTETDNEVNDLAEKLGITDADDIATPLHHKLKRFAVTFFCMRVCQDKAGVNNVDMMGDKYAAKYDIYRKENAALRTEVTYEMFVGDVEDAGDRSSTGTAIILRN